MKANVSICKHNFYLIKPFDLRFSSSFSFFSQEKELKCQILNGSAGHAPVAVSMADVGLAQNVGGEEFYFVYQSQISHIWPDSGSIAGNC